MWWLAPSPAPTLTNANEVDPQPVDRPGSGNKHKGFISWRAKSTKKNPSASAQSRLKEIGGELEKNRCYLRRVLVHFVNTNVCMMKSVISLKRQFAEWMWVRNWHRASPDTPRNILAPIVVQFSRRAETIFVAINQTEAILNGCNNWMMAGCRKWGTWLHFKTK